MEDAAHPVDVVSSPMMPLYDDDFDDANSRLVVMLYASRPGAFVDLAADLGPRRATTTSTRGSTADEAARNAYDEGTEGNSHAGCHAGLALGDKQPAHPGLDRAHNGHSSRSRPGRPAFGTGRGTDARLVRAAT